MSRIAFLIPVCSRYNNYLTIQEIPLLQYTIPTLKPTVEKYSQFTYELYLGYDDTDQYYLDHIEEIIAVIRETIPDLKIFTYRLPTPPSNPCFVWNELYKIAYEAGCNFFYECGDDIKFVTPDWPVKFLEAFNYDDQAPGFVAGQDLVYLDVRTMIMITRKHYEIFGFLFAPEFKNFYCDIWLDRIYTNLGYRRWLTEIKIANGLTRIVSGQQIRYDPYQDFNLESLVARDTQRIRKYLN